MSGGSQPGLILNQGRSGLLLSVFVRLTHDWDWLCLIRYIVRQFVTLINKKVSGSARLGVTWITCARLGSPVHCRNQLFLSFCITPAQLLATNIDGEQLPVIDINAGQLELQQFTSDTGVATCNSAGHPQMDLTERIFPLNNPVIGVGRCTNLSYHS